MCAGRWGGNPIRVGVAALHFGTVGDISDTRVRPDLDWPGRPRPPDHHTGKLAEVAVVRIRASGSRTAH